jgi:hypothetical protein
MEKELQFSEIKLSPKEQETLRKQIVHELLERKLMEHGLSFWEAHTQAESLYDYTAFVKNLNEEAGIK